MMRGSEIPLYLWNIQRWERKWQLFSASINEIPEGNTAKRIPVFARFWNTACNRINQIFMLFRQMLHRKMIWLGFSHSLLNYESMWGEVWVLHPRATLPTQSLEMANMSVAIRFKRSLSKFWRRMLLYHLLPNWYYIKLAEFHFSDT